MIKRLFKVYCFKYLLAENRTFGVINFLGVDYKSILPIKYILKKIFGLNFFGLRLLCQQFNIPCRLPLILFNEVQLVELKSLLFSGSFLSLGGFYSYSSSNYLVGSSLEKSEREHLLKMRQTGFLRASRFRRGLPVRGQRTKTNAKTSRRSFGRASWVGVG